MVTPEAKKVLLEQEIQMYENSKYLFEVRHRTALTLKDKALEEQTIKDVERCIMVLDSLQKELKEVDSHA